MIILRVVKTIIASAQISKNRYLPGKILKVYSFIGSIGTHLFMHFCMHNAILSSPLETHQYQFILLIYLCMYFYWSYIFPNDHHYCGHYCAWKIWNLEHCIVFVLYSKKEVLCLQWFSVICLVLPCGKELCLV